MVFIKKLVMQGFKSFAKRTEVVFDTGINVIIGPNGSGKSNVSDALCFVLGRLSVKSMRAAKAKNLIFMGSKYIKPAREAVVELVFDNSDHGFNIDAKEVVLKRSVRHNGQSMYKINDEPKTRGDIIEMLALAGIDPYGFNLILQGQIQSIVRMHPEERRKIIEEVAGISIYESRKEKSLHELEKTDERLKEIATVLRERTSFLKNLEKEKSQAERFKELETTVKRAKATLLTKRGDEKKKEIASIVKSIEEKTKEKDKVKDEYDKIQSELVKLGAKVEEINKNIQQASGLEQTTLHEQIADLRADLEGLRVRKESYENKKEEIERRISEMQKSIPEIETEIRELKVKSPLMAKKADELKKKKQELQIVEDERRKILTLKTELNSLRERIREKERQLGKVNNDSDSVLKQMESLSVNLIYKNESACSEKVKSFEKDIEEKQQGISQINSKELQNQRQFGVSESEIKRCEEIKSKVKEIDVCPLCQSKITDEHISHVFIDCDEKINKAKEIFNSSKKEMTELENEKNNLYKEIRETQIKANAVREELQRHRNIEDKKTQLKRIVDESENIKKEIKQFEERIKTLEGKTTDLDEIEDNYYSKMHAIEEISSRTEEDVDTSLLYKEREIERIREIVKRSTADFQEVVQIIKNFAEDSENKTDKLAEKEEQEAELNRRFKNLFAERDEKQREIQEQNMNLSDKQSIVRQIEEQINYLKIGKAKLDAEHDAILMELSEFAGTELLQGSYNVIEERLKKSQELLMQIGSINMRALEVYDEVKKEYDKVYEKVETLEKEKAEILKIIEEIDKKKKKSFVKTLDAINELFTRNFGRLSSKGVAYLEIENKEDIFAGGINIVVKLAKGKYFDVTSLSGGEQTLVALSLLFAIQEHKPYHFYIFDEIDAALDKRNSERLAALLAQYMKSGQYIVVTHNDAIIMNSNILYGVSMQDGVSKILSLKV
jgi:chromosome segregation protein